MTPDPRTEKGHAWFAARAALEARAFARRRAPFAANPPEDALGRQMRGEARKSHTPLLPGQKGEGRPRAIKREDEAMTAIEGEITSTELSDLIKVSTPHASQLLAKLTKDGRLKEIGRRGKHKVFTKADAA